MIKYNEANRNQVERILVEISQMRPPHDLTCSVAVQVKYRSLVRAMECEWPSGEPIAWETVRWAVGRNTFARKHGVDALCEMLNQIHEAHRETNATCSKLVRVVFPLWLAVSTDLRFPIRLPASVGGLAVHPFASFSDYFGSDMPREALDAQIEVNKVLPTHYVSGTYANCDLDGATSRFVADFNLWRAAINYCACVDKPVLQFGPGRRARICASGIGYRIDSTGEHSSFFASVPSRDHTDYVRTPVTNEIVEAAEKLLTEIGSTPAKHSTAELLRACLEAFGFALDHADWHLTLVVLWQLSEMACLIGANERHDNIAKRLALMSSIDGVQREELEAAIDEIAALRHSVVHKGAFGNVDESDVRLLETTCVAALAWLRKNLQALPTTEHLRLYFAYGATAPRYRRKLSEVLGMLEQL